MIWSYGLSGGYAANPRWWAPHWRPIEVMQRRVESLPFRFTA